MSDEELGRYSIDSFVGKACKMEWAEVFNYIQSEVEWLDAIPSKAITPVDIFKSNIVSGYRQFLFKVASLIHMGIKPADLNGEDFQKTKPIIESLIAKGALPFNTIYIYHENLN
jgi:hypothetical protein